ncbi:sensor histidine kinase [Jhaorihella thermophila]|uniref:histidine kinase n=1 Tax=Jhaorihella thermophila TaxID=488547 RepID=A0A1H5RN41_9RHOB|nr:HAMP domain-containing sensor histidine kinase [Jhaorihella thermophila]SEF39148.1 Signal transduction histidine kinase [Jhaorihella thermophila]
MVYVDKLLKMNSKWLRGDLLERQLKDYFANTKNLMLQRQSIFFAATTLTAFYFDPVISFMCYGLVLLTEAIDLFLTRRVDKWKDGDPAKARMFLLWAVVNTVFSAVAISLFVILIAVQEGDDGHFTPLFFLFAAAVFAAMYNHQLVPALILRLSIYAGAFLFIALLDIWRYSPPIDSEPWLRFFTVIFVMYFVVDCSFMFLQLYRSNLRQMERLRREHQKAMAAYKVKSQFVSVVSHELRTPLTSIKGSLDLLNSGAMGPVPETMKPLIDLAGKNSQRLATLINDILDFQKIEAGEMTYNFDALEVRKLVVDAVETNRGYGDSLNVSFKLDLPEEDDGAKVLGDETRLMQVLSNILSNAAKFSPEGGEVTVGYRILGSTVRIFVEDHGEGIPENSKHKVFDRFTQVDSSDQRKVGGTGLGMNISKQIVEQHNGEIDYVSELGVGTVFFVTLDLLEESESLAA